MMTSIMTSIAEATELDVDGDEASLSYIAQQFTVIGNNIGKYLRTAFTRYSNDDLAETS